jgi:hypothetical protein
VGAISHEEAEDEPRCGENTDFLPTSKLVVGGGPDGISDLASD